MCCSPSIVGHRAVWLCVCLLTAVTRPTSHHMFECKCLRVGLGAFRLRWSGLWGGIGLSTLRLSGVCLNCKICSGEWSATVTTHQIPLSTLSCAKARLDTFESLKFSEACPRKEMLLTDRYLFFFLWLHTSRQTKTINRKSHHVQ